MIRWGQSLDPALVVFVDLDRTLLDDRHAATLPDRAWKARSAHSHSIVLCSKRTRGEIERIRRQLDLDGPFICENGAVVYLPADYAEFSIPGGREVSGHYAVAFGRPYAEIVDTLDRLAGRFGIDIVGFHHMSVEAVSLDLQMPLLQAQLAKLREFSEPFRFVSGDANGSARFLGALRNAGIGHVEYGRYIHAGPQVSYEAGASVVCRVYQSLGAPVITAAVGDSTTDGKLLELVDVPVIVGADHNDDLRALRRSVPAARFAAVDSMDGIAVLVSDLAQAASGRPRACPH